MKYLLAVLALARSAESWSPMAPVQRYQPSALRATIASPGEDTATVTPDEVADEVALVAMSDERASIGGMLSTRTTSLARRGAVEALSAALTRSLERSDEATGFLAEELSTVATMLDTEIVSEEEKLAGVTALVAKMGDVISGKANVVQRETVLLTKIQEIKAQTLEAVIVRRLEQAAEAKAELISIEMVLSETMEACKTQLETELPLIEKRLASMKKARAELPSAYGFSTDVVAVRAYGFSEIVTLQDLLLQTQRSAAASEEQVAKLRQKIASAMAQRNVLLGVQSQQQLDQEAAVAAAGKAAGVAARAAQAQAAAQAAASPRAGAAAAPRGAASAKPPPAGNNEVELAQQGAFKAGAALLGVAKALVKTVANEEGVGSTLREAIEDAKGATSAFGAAGKKFLEKE